MKRSDLISAAVRTAFIIAISWFSYSQGWRDAEVASWCSGWRAANDVNDAVEESILTRTPLPEWVEWAVPEGEPDEAETHADPVQTFPASAPDRDAMADAVVVVHTGSGPAGSGVVMRDGYALTAWHVIDGAKEVTIQRRDGEVARAKSWHRTGPDAAAIHFSAPLKWPGLPDGEIPKRTFRALVIGYTATTMEKRDRVEVSAVVYGESDRTDGYVHGEHTIVAGLSGSPLIVDGEVVAIVSAWTLGRFDPSKYLGCEFSRTGVR